MGAQVGRPISIVLGDLQYHSVLTRVATQVRVANANEGRLDQWDQSLTSGPDRFSWLILIDNTVYCTVLPTGASLTLTLPWPNLTNHLAQNFITRSWLERLPENLRGLSLRLSWLLPLVMKVAPRPVLMTHLISHQWIAQSRQTL
jgi:hypothetical protein